MFRMSGVAVATAALAASGLLYSVWSWDTTPLKALKRGAPVVEIPLEVGAALVLHSAAWRTAPVEPTSTAVATPVAAPASEAVMFPATGALPTDMIQSNARAVPRAPQTAKAAEPILDQPNAPTNETPAAEPTVQPMAVEAAPTARAPAPRERMSLAGPRIEVPDRSPATAGARHPPRQLTGEHAQPQQAQLPIEAESPKFGPERLKTLDGIGY